MIDAVREFWDNQARQFGTSDEATAPDHFYREHEIRSILPFLRNGMTCLDVGCGNGYSTLRFARAFPASHFLGVDYSDEMIKAAQSANDAANVDFECWDVRWPPLHDPFDMIISERCLINLVSWEEQEEALLNLRDLLTPGGEIILVENTVDGLANLNLLREKLGLHEIKQRWHNCYLHLHKLIDFLDKHFKILDQRNIGNLYYLMSRVLYAKLSQMEGKEPMYDHPINEIAAQLPSLDGYNYSPNFLWHLKKI